MLITRNFNLIRIQSWTYLSCAAGNDFFGENLFIFIICFLKVQLHLCVFICFFIYQSTFFIVLFFSAECFSRFYFELCENLPPFSLIPDFGKQNTGGNVSKISVSLACY